MKFMILIMVVTMVVIVCNSGSSDSSGNSGNFECDGGDGDSLWSGVRVKEWDIMIVRQTCGDTTQR